MEPSDVAGNASSSLASSARFWEPRRLIYNVLLTSVVILWVVATWPHFQRALTLSVLEAMSILALLANVCYCAAYFADIAMQNLVASVRWARGRWALFVFGTMLAVALENYWIADEIYPDVTTLGADSFPQMTAAQLPHIASNMNFPAPVAVLTFVATFGGLFLCAGAILIAWFVRRPKFIRSLLRIAAAGAAVYLALLFGFSLSSRESTLARGQEKYFCEIDCHLAYSLLDVQTAYTASATNHYVVTVRTRFDETTISPRRPKDATLTPSPRSIEIVDKRGRQYAPTSIQGTQLLTPLKPADSYTTQLQFDIPKDASELRLLLQTTPAWPDHFVIGDENSLLHKKTFFGF